MKLLSDSRRLRKFIIWLEGLRALEAAGQAARGGRRGATEGGPRLREPSRQPRRSGFRERARKPESSGRCLGRGYCCLRPSLQSLLRPSLLGRAPPPSGSGAEKGECALPPPERDCVETRRSCSVEGSRKPRVSHRHHLHGLKKRVASQFQAKTPS
ncbi:uncharacterized protein LOC143443505 [Arvicanthis niloticus]|uniref:uncharacterized protein LOC143313750 n=1 Tax=Arvicanthis niloticus TaxID=61156 RepID=UPI00402B0EDB